MLNFYTQKIEKYLEKYNLPNSPENIYRPIDYFLKIGGKRLRPVLTLLATELGGGDVDNAIHAAISIELFHNFSLIHDDIMDDAPKRRGYATVHEKWNSNIAILSGDALLIRAYELISKQKNEHIPDLLKIFNKTAIELCEGQQMDLDFENQNEVTIDEYISMIRLKTSVLLGCALEFGFIISNQTMENRKKIYDFGVNLGIAFQIQDDILDLYGDPEKVGKQVGGDIKANKKTLLYLVSKNIVNSHNHNTLNAINELKDLDKKIEETKKFYDKNGVLEETKKYFDFYHDLSIESLKSLEVIESKDKLFHLVSYLFNRQS